MSWTETGMRRRAAIVFGIWAMAALSVVAGPEKEPELDVPYVPTHKEAVEEMLRLAKITGEDYVIDLGCGDGRIVIAAAKRCKARGLGVDLDPKRVRESKRNAVKARVTDLVSFRKADVMATDIRRATVVTLFLLEEVNVRLRPKLFAELRPGTRVVSNSFHMREWKPDKEVSHAKAFNNTIYFWTIPAAVGGTWTWKTRLGEEEVAGRLKLEQEFQAVRGAVSGPAGTDVPITEASLSGGELRFTASLRAGKAPAVVAYRGVAEGDVIRGTQQWRGGPLAGTYPWIAKRKAVDLIGRWQVRAASHPTYNGTLHIRRGGGGPQAVYVRDGQPTRQVPLPAFYVWGSSIRFEVPVDGLPLAFSGCLERGSGSVHRDQSEERTTWSARRLTGK